MTLTIPKYFCAFLFLALPMTKTLQAQTGTSLPSFTITAQVLQNANCNQKGILLAEAKDGMAPYEYQIVQAIPPGSSPIPPPPPTPIGSWSTSNTFSIAEGTYVLFAKDRMGVVVSTIQTVTKDSAPKTLLTLANRCVPEGNFELQLAATQPGIPPYFLSTNGNIFQSVSLPYTLSNQNSGEYTLTLKDSNGCESAQTITIFSPLAFSAASISQPSCTSNDGIVVVATTGGSANFEYQIIGQLPTTNPVFTSLSSGSYRFRVDDKITGCFEEIEVNLESATPIAGLKLTTTSVSCNGGNDGSITVQIDTSKSSTNDSSTYKYSIDKIHFQSSPLFLGLKAGSYTVDVISERGCTATDTITILEPDSIKVIAPKTVDFNCFSSNNLNQAIIRVEEITGGSGTFIQYEFIKNNSPIQFGTSSTYAESDQTGGEYSITVYDSKGCSGRSNLVTINQFISIEKIIITPTSIVNCASIESIQVSIETKGGIPKNVEYSLVDVQPETGKTGLTYSLQTNSTGVFSGLSAGKYSITVLNKDTGCSLKEMYVVSDLYTFSISIDSVAAVSCHGGNNGSIQFSIIDRDKNSSLAEVNYSIRKHDNTFFYQTTHNGLGPISLRDLISGEYTIQATLSNNLFCSQSKSITILEPEPLVANLTIKTPLNCSVPPLLELVVNGGNPGYTFSSDGTVFNNTILNIPEEIEAGIGSYTIYVKDSKGCRSISNEIRIDSIPGLQVEVDESLATIKCNGETTATISAMASGGLGIYRYSLVDELSNTLRPFQTSGVFTNLGAGNYSIKAESNNCSPAFSKRIIIEELAPLELSLKAGGINEIIALPTGGVGNYTFTFEGEYYDDIPSYIYYRTQDFLVTVQDANGCTASVSQKFNYIDICTPNYFTPNGDGLNDTWAPGCSTNYTNLVFSIYDRYGQELGTYRYGQSWDGNHQGAPLPSGDYWYLLKLNNSKDDREFVGHFTLYR